MDNEKFLLQLKEVLRKNLLFIVLRSPAVVLVFSLDRHVDILSAKSVA